MIYLFIELIPTLKIFFKTQYNELVIIPKETTIVGAKWYADFMILTYECLLIYSKQLLTFFNSLSVPPPS